MSRSISLAGSLILTLCLLQGCVTLTGETAEENYNDATITTAARSRKDRQVWCS